MMEAWPSQGPGVGSVPLIIKVSQALSNSNITEFYHLTLAHNFQSNYKKRRNSRQNLEKENFGVIREFGRYFYS